MYNQQYANNPGSQNQGFQNQGFQKQYQPVGAVQSFYGQNQGQQQQFGGFPSSESFHTANYRGNQQGHDQGLRSDAWSPSQQQQFSGQNATNYGSVSYGIRGNEAAYSGANNVSSQFGFGNPYGNQSSRTLGQSGSAFNQGMSNNPGTSMNQGAYGQSSYGQGANPSAESFHTANYSGNQMGHDAGLRGDSFSPAQQQQFGGQQNTSNYGSFAYGMRGQDSSQGQNNVSQQFGFNNAYSV